MVNLEKELEKIKRLPAKERLEQLKVIEKKIKEEQEKQKKEIEKLTKESEKEIKEPKNISQLVKNAPKKTTILEEKIKKDPISYNTNIEQEENSVYTKKEEESTYKREDSGYKKKEQPKEQYKQTNSKSVADEVMTSRKIMKNYKK